MLNSKADKAIISVSIISNFVLLTVVTIKMSKSPTDVYREVVSASTRLEMVINTLAANQQMILAEIAEREIWMDSINNMMTDRFSKTDAIKWFNHNELDIPNDEPSKN